MSKPLSAAVATIALMSAAPAMAGDGAWKTVADVGLVGLTTAAFGASAYEHDGEGARQLALSLGVTAGATYGLKHAFPELRPDGSDRRSFPSGHTSVSFAAAGYLHQRYGWRAGLPATLVATAVGVARVKSHDHHWYDVVAGAALGEASAALFTGRRDDTVKVFPWADSHGAGFALAARF